MNVPFINVEQAGRCLALCAVAKQPVALVGGPGSGKTEAVKQFAAKLGAKLIVKLLAYCERTDLGGMPFPAEGKVRGVEYLRPLDLPLEGLVKDEEKPIVLFLDEFDRAPMDVQNATLQMLLGGDLNGNRLAKNVFVVLAMNGASDMYTTALSEAARNRICTLFVNSKADGNKESYTNWAREQSIHPMTIGFMNFMEPDTLKAYDEFEELAIATPRSVGEFTSKILYATEAVKFQTDDVLLAVLAGLIGQNAAAKFLAYRSRWKSCPKPEDVLKNPQTAMVPAECDTAFAVGCSVIGLTMRNGKPDRALLDKAVRYIARLPADAAAGLFRSLNDKGATDVSTIPTYQSWAAKNKDLIGRN